MIFIKVLMWSNTIRNNLLSIYHLVFVVFCLFISILACENYKHQYQAESYFCSQVHQVIDDNLLFARELEVAGNRQKDVKSLRSDVKLLEDHCNPYIPIN